MTGSPYNLVPRPSVTDSTSTQLHAAQVELRRLTTELATERAISARFLTERDVAVRAGLIESIRLTAALATEQAANTRLLQEREELVSRSRQHVQLSSYLGEYTSEFLDSKTCCERAALLGSIRATTKGIWDSGSGMPFEMSMKVIRTMMAEHGFVFREPGEGETGWHGYALMVPNVDVLEQLDRAARTHRADLGAAIWYFTELVAVLYRIVKYLEENP